MRRSDLYGDRQVTIVVRTLSERIFEVIRERIIEGKLPDREPVRVLRAVHSFPLLVFGRLRVRDA